MAFYEPSRYRLGAELLKHNKEENTYEDYVLVSQTSDWKRFWTRWYSITKNWGIGPMRTIRTDVNERANDIIALSIYYTNRHKM